VTRLRKVMLEELQRRNFSSDTINAVTSAPSSGLRASLVSRQIN